MNEYTCYHVGKRVMKIKFIRSLSCKQDEGEGKGAAAELAMEKSKEIKEKTIDSTTT